MRVLPDVSLGVLSIDEVGQLLEEWRDWNSGYSWKPDAGGYLSDVFNLSDDIQEGRVAMNQLYDEAVRRWRDAGHEFKL
jgi:hypothetical protein